MKQSDVDKAIAEAFSQYEYETTGNMVDRAKSIFDPIYKSIENLKKIIQHESNKF